jgi:hypothetical protein
MIHAAKDFSTPPEQTPPPDGYITLHAPDGPIIAHQPASRPGTRLDAALLAGALAPERNWHWYLLVLAF